MCLLLTHIFFLKNTLTSGDISIYHHSAGFRLNSSGRSYLNAGVPFRGNVSVLQRRLLPESLPQLLDPPQPLLDPAGLHFALC